VYAALSFFVGAYFSFSFFSFFPFSILLHLAGRRMSDVLVDSVRACMYVCMHACMHVHDACMRVCMYICLQTGRPNARCPPPSVFYFFLFFFIFLFFLFFSIFCTCRPVVWMYDVLVDLCSHRANCAAARYVKVFELEGVERIPQR
jgi:hypothetical protein